MIATTVGSTSSKVSGFFTPRTTQSEEEVEDFYQYVAPMFKIHLSAAHNGTSITSAHIASYSVVLSVSTQVVAGLNVNYLISYMEALYEIRVFRILIGLASLIDRLNVFLENFSKLVNPNVLINIYHI